jgi:hypothetical protein
LPIRTTTYLDLQVGERRRNVRLAFLRQLHTLIAHRVRFDLVVVECLREHGARLTDRLAPVRRQRLASSWGLDKGEIALWAERAAATTTASHAYSTRVFRAVPIDFVTLELQVEHHLEPDVYVLDVLFSWDADA